MIATSGLDMERNGLHVLVAEDSTTTRRVFKSRLEEMGVTVTEAEDGEVALSLIRDGNQQFDIVFCDIQMPKMNGYELCKTLSEAEWFDNTPIVMVSTCSDAREVIKALKLGADDFIPKPYERDLLMKVIKRVRL